MKIYCEKCKKVFEAEKPAEGSQVECPNCKEKVNYPETRTSPGAVIGGFVIERELSKGGMGEVYLARQISLDRLVALKVLQAKFLNDKEYVEAFFREARAAARINHPNVVQAYAVGEENGIFYFAMEYIRGKTMKEILKEKKVLDFVKSAKIIREVASALECAWRDEKLVHQDIKPDNIMLDANGFAKLADLGLARVAGINDKEASEGDEVLGTPQYISPEQLTGVPTDVRSDIYSLGATFYQFVTGRFPYVADTAEEIAKMHVAGHLQPPKEVNPDLPDELNTIIMKMMARNIEDRYQTPAPLIKALEFPAAESGTICRRSETRFPVRRRSESSIWRWKISVRRQGTRRWGCKGGSGRKTRSGFRTESETRCGCSSSSSCKNATSHDNCRRLRGKNGAGSGSCGEAPSCSRRSCSGGKTGRGSRCSGGTGFEGSSGRGTGFEAGFPGRKRGGERECEIRR